MNSLSSSLSQMGSNFLVAGLIPALAFLTAIMLTFEPILPMALKTLIGGTFDPISEKGVTTLIFATILGFTLTSLNTFILKFFEGYILFWRFPFLRWPELRRFTKARNKIARIRGRIKLLERLPNNKYRAELLEQLYSLEMELVTNFENTLPSRSQDVLPFRFGNTLRAAESYPSLRYHIDAVPLWTRLIHVLPPSYDAKIEASHNQLSFLINCTVLSGIYVFITLGAGLFQLLTGTKETIYLSGVLFGIGSTLIFNRAAVLSVDEFGDMIRSAYDLFRLDLLKRLNIKQPVDSEAERIIWQRISKFINVGYSVGSVVPFNYELKPEDHGNSKVLVSPEIALDNNDK